MYFDVLFRIFFTGAFLVAYFFWLFVVGIPVYFLEVTIGQYSGRGAVRVWDVSTLLRGTFWFYVLSNLKLHTFVEILSQVQFMFLCATKNLSIIVFCLLHVA